MWAGAALVLALACQLGGASGMPAYLQWSSSGDNVNYPYSSLFPPLLSPDASGKDRLVLFTGGGGSSWNLSALNVSTGEPLWSQSFSSSSSGAPPTPLVPGVQLPRQASNGLNMVFFQMGDTVYAVNPADGSTAWTHATFNATQALVSGWNDATNNYVYLASTGLDKSTPIPMIVNTFECLEASRGQQLWSTNASNNALSGLIQANTASTWGVTPAPGLAMFAVGAKITALLASNGSQAWTFSAASGASNGLNANVTQISYVEAGGPRKAPSLLLTTNNFGQVRFLGFALNSSSNISPTMSWLMAGGFNYEGAFDDRLEALGVRTVAVAPEDDLFYFWSNRTYYDAVSGTPKFRTMLVARMLSTGAERWSLVVADEPRSPPAPANGNILVTTSGGLSVYDGPGGALLWTVNAAPPANAQSGGAGYTPAGSFDDWQGQLAVVRCLGSDKEAGSICVYSGYAPSPMAPSSHAARGRLAAGAATAAAGLALAVLLAL